MTGERHAAIPLPFRAAGLSRFRLDEALLASAEGAGVHVVRGARVSSVEESSGDAVVAEDGDYGLAWQGSCALRPESILCAA